MTTAKFHQLNDFVQVGSEMVTGMNCMDPKIRTSFEYLYSLMLSTVLLN